jgi:hypothetical protein
MVEGISLPILYGDGLESANNSGLSEVHAKKIRDQVDFTCDRIHRQRPRPSARESVAPERRGCQ